MASRASLTSQLQWALVQAERRKATSTPPSLSREASLHSVTSFGEEHEQRVSALPADSGGQAEAAWLRSQYGCEGGGWDTELVWDSVSNRGSPSISRQQNSLEEWLSDEGDNSDVTMLDDLLAYQIIHNELADMIGDVSTRFESLGPCSEAIAASDRNSEVDNWVASIWSGGGAGVQQEQCLPSQHAQDGEEEVESHAAKGGTEKTLEEVTQMLLECGEAVVVDDVGRTHKIVERIRQYSNLQGNHLQRLAHYFVEALIARLNGTAADLYMAIMKRDRQAVLQAEKEYMSQDPTAAIAHHFAKNVLLEAFEGAERVHIIDYGMLGHQWQSLIQALAYQPSGPPRLRITGIELPQVGANPDGVVKETGRKLSKIAASLGIPFEFKGIRGRFEDIQVSQLGIREDEVLAVSSVFRLKHLLDDSVVLSNPRRTVLERICSMNPRVFIMAERSLAGNAPFLMSRLREAIPSWYSFFECAETILPKESETRRLVEQESFNYRILNLIACEGTHRIERPESYHQWHWRLVNAGFEPSPLSGSTVNSIREVMRDYRASWTIALHHEWILTGWEGRVHHAFSAWRPASSK